MEELIQRMEEAYQLTVKKHEILRDTSKSLVIRVNTSKGKYIGKRLYISTDRQLFILDAEEHLRKKGILIPEVRKTKDNERYILWNNYPFILQKWVPWPMIALNAPIRIRRVGATMGNIHFQSQGFSSPNGQLYNGSLGWEQEYEQDLSTMDGWHREHDKNTDPKVALIASYLPVFLEAGVVTHNHLAKSRYFSKWKKQPLSQHFLCHGDFNNGNLLSSEKKVAVIDWEDVRYDYPSKDISRLLYLLMRKERQWVPSHFSHLLIGYLREHPLSREQLHLLFVDLAFPHIFERFLRTRQYQGMTVEEVRNFLQREASKTFYMLKEMMTLV